MAIRLTGSEYARDPHAVFAAMRAEGSILRVKLPIMGRVWTTSTYEAAKAVLKSDDFVVEGRNVEGKTRAATPGLRWWMPRVVHVLTQNMLSRDDPDHRRLRKLVDLAFRRRDVQAMRGDIRATAERMVDALPAECDLLPAFARPFPLAVIADLLGLRERTRAEFMAASAPLSDVASPLGFLRAVLPLRGLVRLIEEEIEAARRDPRPGVIGELVRVEQEMSGDEFVAMVFVLLVAGYETTSHLIVNSVRALAENPAERDRWLAAPDERTERAVEELARYASAIHMTKPRYVARDMEFMGTTLRAGEIVMPSLGAANADPTVFDAPERLDLDRFPNPHLVFSTGSHFCLGMQLARIEVQEAILALHTRRGLPRVLGAPQWSATIGKRQLKALFVSWDRLDGRTRSPAVRRSAA